MKNFYLITLFMCLSNLQAWATGSSEKAVYDLIERVTPGYASQYRLEIISSENGNDIYEVDGDGQKIILRGNNAVSLATAFNWYLKYTCHAHVSWFVTNWSYLQSFHNLHIRNGELLMVNIAFT